MRLERSPCVGYLMSFVAATLRIRWMFADCRYASNEVSGSRLLTSKQQFTTHCLVRTGTRFLDRIAYTQCIDTTYCYICK